jgi:hypothetical protein
MAKPSAKRCTHGATKNVNTRAAPPEDLARDARCDAVVVIRMDYTLPR